MAPHVALLRGINVGGRRRIAMADLRALLDDAGLGPATTYLQSGNVIFDLDASDPQAGARSISNAIADRLGHDVTVIVRSATALAAVLQACPYGQRDPTRVGIAFLSDVPAGDAAARLDPGRVAPDEFALIGVELHLWLPNGFGKAKLTNARIESLLGVSATTRNLRTVRKMIELAG